MRIAISMRVVENSSYPETRDALSQEWVELVQAWDAKAVLFPLLNQISHTSRFLEEVTPELLILSNGNDLGESPQRDATEKLALDWACARKIPVLGICRGFQMINSYFGGSITRNIRESTGENHVAVTHQLQISHPALQKILGDSFEANSFHNQGVLKNQLAPDLTAFAATAAGVLEGFVHNSLPVLGLQWHPERAGTDPQKNLQLLRALQKGKFW